jgi:hypothetical protein
MTRNDRREVAEGIRCAIITLHGQSKMNFADIGRVDGIGLGRKTCSNIWHTAMRNAQVALQTDEVLPWHVMINYTKSQPRPGRPKQVTSCDKTQLRHASSNNKGYPSSVADMSEAVSVDSPRGSLRQQCIVSLP